MSKLTDAIKATLKGYFNLGDVPTEEQYAALMDAIQEGVQEHEHTATGGPGAGTGDAGPVKNLMSGAESAKPPTPEVGDVYIETDTTKFYVCYSAGVWTQV